MGFLQERDGCFYRYNHFGNDGPGKDPAQQQELVSGECRPEQAVSYTHLDVYKRQPEQVGAECHLLQRGFEKGVPRTFRSVSYTHLDVYKRQLFDEALAAYHAKKKKTRDKIPDYYEHIRQSKQEKLCLLYTSRCV